MHRYILERYNGIKSRHTCPNCNRKHRFTRYVDTETGNHLADDVGKCDRIDHCGYHYPPRDYFAGNPALQAMNYEPSATNHFDTLPYSYVDNTTKAYEHNNFMLFLTRCFGEDTATRLAQRYRIGTSKHWPGATIFWQIDVNEKVRTGKIMLYDRTNGHRVKHPYNHIAWVHSLSQNKSEIEHPKSEFKLQQCFFGEHLLNIHPFRTVAVVESEKTAIVCSHFYPEYIWLAAGSLEGLTISKCRILDGRRVRLYPDLNAAKKWKLKAIEIKVKTQAIDVTVDINLERTATPTERTQGIDKADRLIDEILKINATRIY